MSPERSAQAVGVITSAAGLASMAAPARVGGLASLHRSRDVRLVGISDLVLVPGLLFGRPKWPWMVARASFNLLLAGLLVARLDEARDPIRSKALAAAMIGLTTADVATIRALRDSER